MTQRKEMIIEALTLEGQHVRLEPLALDHHAQLCEVAFDESIWRWMPYAITSPEEMRSYIERMGKLQERRMALPFATIAQAANRVVGGTSYLNINTFHRRIEIGATWIGVDWQRTAINTEAKYLMLRHAFETLGCIRVEFKTDSNNERSMRAIARIGAKKEGTLRNHMISRGGRIRHSVYYSIIDSEWPQVKIDLEEMLSRKHPNGGRFVNG